MKYIISYQNPNSHYIDIQVEVDDIAEATVQLQLPAWRPGRYELGNFAKNIQKWEAFDDKGNLLIHKKLTKDLWEVETNGVTKISIQYNYFANDLNAGSTFLDSSQIYMNPVNCMLYVPSRTDEQCELEIKIPEDFKIAIPLKATSKNIFIATNFDELADSPFIASSTIQHHSFKVGNTLFHLWFQGESKLDWDLLEKDFIGFTKPQIAVFGDFPTEEYHYLFQIVPYSGYHGVEHAASTVILLGPTYSIMKKEGRYEDLLGVSSHELFHTWNVKRIRPIEMVPYDFSKENYSKLGYLSEGATTWYGDLMLYRGKVFDDAAFFRTFNQILERHFNNPGALNMSVADSSFDTWLDGYEVGVPNRKASIYTEGALLTFMMDFIIRNNTGNKKSFDNVLNSFYSDFYKNEKGISEADYKKVVEKFANQNLDEFFAKYINGAEEFNTPLQEAFDYFGLELNRIPSALFHEAYLGVKMNENKVVAVFPNSPAEKAGISIEDEVVIINKMKNNGDLSQWLEYFKDDQIYMGAFDKSGVAKSISVELTDAFYYSKYEVAFSKELTDEQKRNVKSWRGF